MKIGTVLLAILFGAIFLFWKYPTHVKNVLGGIRGMTQTTKAPSLPTAKTDGKGIRVFWTIALIIAGLVVFFLGMFSSVWKAPSFTEVSSWGWNHWMQLLVLWGIGAGIIELNKKALGAATYILQWVPGGILVLIFFIAPLIGKYETSAAASNPSQHSAANVQTVCPDVTAKETRSCVITTEWSNWVKMADGANANGKQVCFSRGVKMERKDEGVTFLRFKTEVGKMVVAYRLFPGNEECSKIDL